MIDRFKLFSGGRLPPPPPSPSPSLGEVLKAADGQTKEEYSKTPGARLSLSAKLP